jgi:diguanylate cyclase (GGDEF)-like protein
MSTSSNGADPGGGDASRRRFEQGVGWRWPIDEIVSESDQTAADLDQTMSDSDQTDSDADQAVSEADQTASDRDQLASDRESLSSDQGVRDKASDDRGDSTRERERQAHARASTALSRQASADARDRSATERDRLAVARDAAAEAFDRAPDGGKGSAQERDTARERRVSDRERAADDRAKAARDRQRASDDRARASADRADAVRERAQARRELAQAALALEVSETDELTHVRRRGAGMEQLQREMDRARRASEPLVVAFIDVDGLKGVNDRAGHAAGDTLLVAVAESLRACTRSYDLIVRVGGDEFVCVLLHTNLDTVRERFIQASGALAAGPTAGSITIGFAELAQEDSPSDLIARADADLLAQRQTD